ncbi:hypothetical protein AKO1_013091 [Acrasis kona]|uniref:VWFA domain-containing protein n=1 Tax=Acrasis kona TaxID=1008807 RepID=A0AAW2YZ49_9EUKA
MSEKFQGLIDSVEQLGLDFSMRFKPTYKYLPSNSLGLRTESPVLFQLVSSQKRAKEQSQSNPLEVCILLDVSGSMEGRKLMHCKQAINQLVFIHLQEQDVFHLVTFDDQIKTIYQDIHKSKVKEETINAIRSGGSTNISDAIGQGINILSNSNKDNHIKLMLLFSDGNANVGITDINVLGRTLLPKFKDYNVHFNSFGIGDDFNERWLSSLARVGSGDYFYINNVEEVKALLVKCLNKYKFQIGRNARLTIFGVRPNLLVSFNNKSDQDSLIKGNKVGNIFCGDLKQTIFNIEVNDSSLPMFKYVLSYDALPSNEKVNIEGTFVYNEISSISDELLQKDDDCLLYQAIMDFGKEQAIIQEHVTAERYEQAKQSKEKLIAKIESMLSVDYYGVLTKILENEKETLKDLANGINKDSLKKQHEKSNKLGAVTKFLDVEDYEDECDESDEEVGFGGLF